MATPAMSATHDDTNDAQSTFPTNEEERLVRLFRNRAELKKEFSNLRDDRDQLLDKIKEEESATLRVRKQLAALEARLANPDTGYNAIVYYQLCALWVDCNRQLRKFSEELIKQQEDRERRRQIMEFNQERQKRLAKLSDQILVVKAESDDMKKVVQTFEERVEALRGFWNYFKRRRMMVELEEQRELFNTVRARIEEMFDRRIKVESEPWPDYPGLGVEGKRAINLAVIALAQHLYLQVAENKLGAKAKLVQVKGVQEITYGTRSDCEYLMAKISEAADKLKGAKDYAETLTARTNFLARRVEYRADEDTVPRATCTENIPVKIGLDANGESKSVGGSPPLDVNVLAEDFWDLHSVILS